MKKDTLKTILLFVLLALPIPISLISWIGTIMAIAAVGMIDLTNFSEIIVGIIAFTTMLIAGTYPITYIISLIATIATIKAKNSHRKVFLPIYHILAFIGMLVIWMLFSLIFIRE